jgi:hypothetical protein
MGHGFARVVFERISNPTALFLMIKMPKWVLCVG